MPGPGTRGWCALVAAACLLGAAPAGAQDCAGAQVLTREAYLYGRFETRMQSAQGDGIVSAFFLYNLDLGCNWPQENNEIDIEMTGSGKLGGMSETS